MVASSNTLLKHLFDKLLRGSQMFKDVTGSLSTQEVKDLVPNSYLDERFHKRADVSDLIYFYSTANSSYQPLSKPHTSLSTPRLCLCWFPMLRQPCHLLSTCRSPLFSPTHVSPYFLQGCPFFAFLSVMVMLYHQLTFCCCCTTSIFSQPPPPNKKVSVSIIMLGTSCLKIFFLQNVYLVSPPRARR